MLFIRFVAFINIHYFMDVSMGMLHIKIYVSIVGYLKW